MSGLHHKRIHVDGWRVELGKTAGVVHWFKPNYEPNRAPPDAPDSDELARYALASG